jgi:hypothetical protein
VPLELNLFEAPMKHILTILICLFALNLTAQEVVVEYPYNPDFENDGNVGVEDLLQLLSAFNMAFEVGELTIDEVVLSEWLQTISETLVAQQAMIDSLMSNEANSGMGQLDSALIADMINEAGSPTASFGERVHLAEPADWGPLPWDDYVNYGTYDFDDAGIFMGRFQYSFYDIYVLHDSIDVQELSSSQLQNHSVARTSNGLESFSVAVSIDERIIVRGMPNSFGDSDHYNFDWVPLLSSSPSATSEAESLGLAFGERFHLDIDSLEWELIDFPERLVSTFNPQEDGILFVKGNCPFMEPVELLIVPNEEDHLNFSDLISIDSFNFNIVLNNDGKVATGGIPVMSNEKVLFGQSSTYTCTDLDFSWIPLISANSTAEIDGSSEDDLEEELSSQAVYFDTPQQEITLAEHTTLVNVGGNTFEENGCSGCHYGYDLYLPNGEIPNGFEMTIWYNPNPSNAPFLRVFNNSGGMLFDEWGPNVSRYVWYGVRWYRL